MKNVTVAILLALMSSSVQAQLFQEGFESGLGAWVGKSNGSHRGVIVPDPHDSSNHVLTFSGLMDSGDIFSTEIAVNPSSTYLLQFDYLGLPLAGSPDGNYGGYIGYFDGETGGGWNGRWLAGTINVVVDLIDDGEWHSYEIEFIPEDGVTVTNETIRIMLEDWNGSGCSSCPPGVPGDAFFDNIVLGAIQTTATGNASWTDVKELFR